MSRRTFTISYLGNRREIRNRLTFNSSNFSYSSNAQESMNRAVNALKRNGYGVFESRMQHRTYSIVFEAPFSSKIKKAERGNFTFSSEAKEAAERRVSLLKRRGNIILEKNVKFRTFTISYLNLR